MFVVGLIAIYFATLTPPSLPSVYEISYRPFRGEWATERIEGRAMTLDAGCVKVWDSSRMVYVRCDIDISAKKVQ